MPWEIISYHFEGLLISCVVIQWALFIPWLSEMDFGLSGQELICTHTISPKEKV